MRVMNTQRGDAATLLDFRLALLLLVTRTTKPGVNRCLVLLRVAP